MDQARKILLGFAVLSIAAGAWTLHELTGFGPWFAAGVGSAAVFVLAGSNLVGWAFGSRRVDACADEDFAHLVRTRESAHRGRDAPPSPVSPPASVLFPDSDGR